MKFMVIAFSILSLTLCVCLYGNFLLETHTTYAIAQLEIAQAYGDQEDYVSGVKHVKIATDYWEKHVDVLGTFFKQNEIDALTQQFYQLQEFGENESDHDFEPSCIKLIMGLSCLNSMEVPKFTNILAVSQG